MEKTILIGDMLFGNKFIYGMKTPTWLGIPYTRMGFDVPWARLPEFKKVENGDVVIFEYPRDPFQKYVKRCIGIPEDSIRIDRGEIYINNDRMSFPKDGNKTGKFIEPTEEQYGIYSQFRSIDQNQNNTIANQGGGGTGGLEREKTLPGRCQSQTALPFSNNAPSACRPWAPRFPHFWRLCGGRGEEAASPQAVTGPPVSMPAAVKKF